MPPEVRFPLSPVALFRYQAVCAVEVRIDGGVSLAHAVTDVVRLHLRDVLGRTRRVSDRSLYRWVKAYRAGGIEALETEPRQKIADSAVLPQELVDFVRVEKQRDTLASIPELLRRAQQKGIVAEDESISRVSVWRACRRMELPTARRKKAGDDKRRFPQPDVFVGPADGRHARQAHFVDGGGRHRQWDSGLGGGLAAGDLAGAGLDDVAKQDLVDLLNSQPGAL